MRSAEYFAKIIRDDEVGELNLNALVQDIQRDAMAAMRDAAVAECDKLMTTLIGGKWTLDSVARLLGDRIANIDLDKLMEPKP